MAADDLVTQGTKAFAAIELTYQWYSSLTVQEALDKVFDTEQNRFISTLPLVYHMIVYAYARGRNWSVWLGLWKWPRSDWSGPIRVGLSLAPCTHSYIRIQIKSILRKPHMAFVLAFISTMYCMSCVLFVSFVMCALWCTLVCLNGTSASGKPVSKLYLMQAKLTSPELFGCVFKKKTNHHGG